MRSFAQRIALRTRGIGGYLALVPDSGRNEADVAVLALLLARRRGRTR